MYHPYLNLEANRIVNLRHQAADMARRVERARQDRANWHGRTPTLLTRLEDQLRQLGSSGRVATQSARLDTRLPAVSEE